MRTHKHDKAKALDQAVSAFLALLIGKPAVEADAGVAGLVREAFAAYQAEWNCCGRRGGHDIREWNWPADQLKEPSPFTEASAGEAWQTPLREALAIARPPAPAVPGARSWKVGVKTRGDREWVYNGQRWPTKARADEAGSSLAWRWTAVEEWESHPSDDEPNQPS